MAAPHPQARAHMTPHVLPGPHVPPSLTLGPWAGSLLITEQPALGQAASRWAPQSPPWRTFQGSPPCSRFTLVERLGLRFPPAL